MHSSSRTAASFSCFRAVVGIRELALNSKVWSSKITNTWKFLEINFSVSRFMPTSKKAEGKISVGQTRVASATHPPAPLPLVSALAEVSRSRGLAAAERWSAVRPTGKARADMKKTRPEPAHGNVAHWQCKENEIDGCPNTVTSSGSSCSALQIGSAFVLGGFRCFSFGSQVASIRSGFAAGLAQLVGAATGMDTQLRRGRSGAYGL
jgi:hypothetical protein